MPESHVILYLYIVNFYLFAGTSHCADMYPPSDTDPPELTQARAQIGTLIGKWIQRPTK